MERTRTSSNAGVYLAAGPLLALAIGWLGMDAWSLDWPSAAVAAVTAWCALWWLTEPVPIPVTSLLPMALLPLAGALTPGQVAASYGSPLILLLLGGFMLSGALAKSGAHRRLAMAMIRACAHLGRKGLVLGFMLAAATLSMWISNTATTSLLMPVLAATAIAADLPPELLMVPAAVSASCAFMLPVATAPNAVVYGSGRVTIAQMAREGIVINLIAAVVITLVVTLRFG